MRSKAQRLRRPRREESGVSLGLKFFVEFGAQVGESDAEIGDLLGKHIEPAVRVVQPGIEVAGRKNVDDHEQAGNRHGDEKLDVTHAKTIITPLQEFQPRADG